MTEDERYMELAARLAARGLGATYPNPSVGAVVVSRQRIVGRARTAPTGGPHAEVGALRRSGAAARGGTLYVTLEPCCHVGRTGPCTTAILEAGIARVVVGVKDPASHVDGKGIRLLRRAGVEVVLGVLAARCAAVHEHYLFHVRHGRPFVTLKSASSLDGRIATQSGDSRWITGEVARKEVHRLRAVHHAIAVGLGTVLADDPRLDVRAVRGTSPTPVVFDSKLSLGRKGGKRYRVLREGTLILHESAAPKAARARLRDLGVEPIEVSQGEDGRVDVAAALEALGQRNIRSLLVEGGGTLLASFVRAELWQRWYYFIAPRILGEGRAVVSSGAWPMVAQAPRVQCVSTRRFAEDRLWVLEPA